jgi:hypothetical protein
MVKKEQESKILSEDELSYIIMESKLSIDMISERIYEEIIRESRTQNGLTNKDLFMAKVTDYYYKSIELLKSGDFLHSFIVILGIYELQLMELPDINKQYINDISLEYLDLYTYKVLNRDLSIKDKQILIELLLSEYDKYELDNIFDFEDFIRMLKGVIVDKDITVYFLKNIKSKVLYKLEKNDYIISLKNKVF